MGICELNKAINASNPGDLQYHANGAYLLNLYRRMPCNDSACTSGGPNTRCFYKNGITEECIGCSTPLGLGDGTIPDSSFKSSSSYMLSRDIAFLARLNLQRNWATYARPNEWVQVDLSKVVLVTKIATQGSYWSNLKYVKTYFIHHALDGENWESYKENGKQKVCA
ncbi:Lactadherin [Exaiptasia diaphana]|nr:Lactadherin [Exaiptasia diaphana]